MSWELFISARYLFGREKERFISFVGLISILGVAVGVAALIIVIGVMNGFDEELQGKIIGINSHLLVTSDPGIVEESGISEKIIRMKHVEATSNFVSGQAMLQVQRGVMGVLLKGVDPPSAVQVSNIGTYIKKGSMQFGEDGVVVGSELAKKFGIDLGDSVSVLSLPSRKPIRLKVCGIFTSGMYEYDLNLVFVSVEKAQEIMGMKGLFSGVAIKVDRPSLVRRIRNDIQTGLGFPYWVQTWMDLNRNLFAALKLEKIVMFVILALIVLVACFNIASTLIMVVLEKTKDIGVLKAVGAPISSIIKIFVFMGLLIGSIGTFIGGISGLWLARLLGSYPIVERFGLQEIYYFNRLPVRIGSLDFFLVVSIAIIISLLATFYPSFKAARLNPVDALRYE